MLKKVKKACYNKVKPRLIVLLNLPRLHDEHDSLVGVPPLHPIAVSLLFPVHTGHHVEEGRGQPVLGGVVLLDPRGDGQAALVCSLLQGHGGADFDDESLKSRLHVR